jgi:hypothetical protein
MIPGASLSLLLLLLLLLFPAMAAAAGLFTLCGSELHLHGARLYITHPHAQHLLVHALLLLLLLLHLQVLLKHCDFGRCSASRNAYHLLTTTL